MPTKDKSYRFRLSSDLFTLATQQAERVDLSLAQVLRRFIRAWVEGRIELPEPTLNDAGDSEPE